MGINLGKYTSSGNWLTHEDLPSPYQEWTVESVSEEELGQGSEAEMKVCLKFREDPKKLSLNKTNLREVVASLGPDTDSWAGRVLGVYRTDTSYEGRFLMCIRLTDPRKGPLGTVRDVAGNAVRWEPKAPAGQVGEPEIPF